MLVIGLTGGVGSGKTTVSEFLQELGAVVLDADRVGHESYLPNTPAWKDIVETFGQDLLLPSQEIDRKKLGSIVFNDPADLAKLNSIVHPRMRGMMQEQLNDLASKGAETVVLEAAILIEAGWVPLVDEVWATEAGEEAVIDRLHRRNNWPEDQIRDRIRAQLPSAERAAQAQVVINTDCTLDEVKQKVSVLWETRVVKRTG